MDEPADSGRLRREWKILALSYQNATYIPSFQFDERGHPRPAVAKVIQILGKYTSDWGVALWFTGANGWLGDKRPVDLLADYPERVVQAAEQEAAELSLVLFGDRVPSSMLRVAGPSLPLDSGPGYDEVCRLADEAGILIFE